MARDVKFGETLRTLLSAKGARTALTENLEISTSALGQYMTNKSRPSFDTLVALSDYLKIGLDDLVFGAQQRPATAPPDYHFAVRHIERSVNSLKATTDAQTRLFSRLTAALATRLKDESDRLAKLGISRGGIITDTESAMLEEYRLESSILSMNLDDIVDSEQGKEAGSFAFVVSKNIQRNRTYRFLLSARVADWTPQVRAYRTLLAELCGDDRLVLTNCAFRQTHARVFSGCAFYKLDLDAFGKERGIDQLRFEEWVINGRLGYLIAASRETRADSLMDETHLEHAWAAFNALWKEATPIAT